MKNAVDEAQKLLASGIFRTIAVHATDYVNLFITGEFVINSLLCGQFINLKILTLGFDSFNYEIQN